MPKPSPLKTRAKREATYEFGIKAERIAAIFLMLKGYRIISKRYRNHQGEIDVLASKGNILAVVEVKARKDFTQCEISVPPWKQKKIVRAVEGLMAERSKIACLAKPNARNIRFDVIWVVRGRMPRHLKDAWRP